MSNEAAERLLERLEAYTNPAFTTDMHADLNDALAAERRRAIADHQALCDERVREHGDAVRRATVERIRERLGWRVKSPAIAAILDGEAAR